jgi:hypothetical protein
MLFRGKVTLPELASFPKPACKSLNLEWFWVTLTKEDFSRSLHVFINRTLIPWAPRGWQKFLSNSCLCSYAEALAQVEFGNKRGPTIADSGFELIRTIAQDFDFRKFLKSPLQLLGNCREGPYMIVDGNHRLLGLYINLFTFRGIRERSLMLEINQENQAQTDPLFPLTYAICAIAPKSKRGKFSRIPTTFCDGSALKNPGRGNIKALY